MWPVFLTLLSVSFFVVGQCALEHTDGRPKYQRALTDLVPANLITVLDKYHRPIVNNYEPPEPTKQKLTKAEILSKFTKLRFSATTTATTTTSTPSTTTTKTTSSTPSTTGSITTTTTTTTTKTTRATTTTTPSTTGSIATSTTRKPSTYVTSYPALAQTDSNTETPFSILFIQTTSPSSSSSSSSGSADSTAPAFFTRVVTQTAKTVSVLEDGIAYKTETVTPPSWKAAAVTSSNIADFSPVFVYKNHRFTSDSPGTLSSVAGAVSGTLPYGDVLNTEDKIQPQTVHVAQSAQSTAVDSSSTQRPRRKVIKIKSRKVLKNENDTPTTTEKPFEQIQTLVKPENSSGSGSSNKPFLVRNSKANVQRERSKVLITRRLTTPLKLQTSEAPTTTTTPFATADTTGDASRRIRRPTGLRRHSANLLPEKSMSETSSTEATTSRSPYRTNRLILSTERAPTTILSGTLQTTSAPATHFERTKTPLKRITQLTRTSSVTSAAQANTRFPETQSTPFEATTSTSTATATATATTTTTTTRTTTTPTPTTTPTATTTTTPTATTTTTTTTTTPTPTPMTLAETEPSGRRVAQKRIVTRIGTSRPVTSTTIQMSPSAETVTTTAIIAESTPAFRSVKKVIRRKKKLVVSTLAPEFVTPEETTVTPVSIVYFQTGRFTTPESTVTEVRRVGKKRRKRPTTPAGVVSTQPIAFSPTEPSTFSAPQAVTGFRPLTTSNYFITPEHLQHLPKTDEISQVINLPGGRLSSYQARYSHQRQSDFLPSQEYGSILNPLPQHVARILSNQKAVRPGSVAPDEFFTNDPTYQDLQRLLAAETNRFHSQPRNSARYSAYQEAGVGYRSSK